MFDTIEVIACKAVVSSGPFYASPEDMPKLYADLGTDHTLVDTHVIIYYNSALGTGPTSILSMTPDHTEGLPWSHGYVEGADFFTNYHQVYLGSRTIRENYTVSRSGYFSNGFVGTRSRVFAQYQNYNYNYRKIKLTAGTFEYQGNRLPAGIAQSQAPEAINGGYPKALTLYDNGGFTTTAVACDAEWNTNLAFLQVTSPGDTRFVRVQWDYSETSTPGVTTLPTPIKASTTPTAPLSSRDETRMLPSFFGDLTFNAEYAAASKPSGFFPANSGNPFCSIGDFKGYEGAADPESLWKKAADFNGDLETQPGTTHTASYSGTGHKLETSGTYAGYIMQSNGPLWPTTDVAFPGSGATFTREEIP